MENNIQQLVLAFFNMQGIKCKEAEKDIWVAQIPEKEQSFFNCGDKLKFTFDKEKAELYRDVEMVGEGSFLFRKIIEKLGTTPKVSRIFVGKQPDIPESSGIKSIADKMHYKTSVAFNFKVSIICDQNKDMLYSVVEDKADSSLKVENSLFTLDLNDYSEQPDSRIKLDEPGSDVLKKYLIACQKLEEKIQDEVDKYRKISQAKCREEMKVFDDYLNEQKAELLQKKENVSFHLYFFQKEEEIDKLINNLEEERKRKLSELEEKYKVKVNISLINAILICSPESGTSISTNSGGKIIKLKEAS